MHPMLFIGEEHTFERMIIGFAASAREDDLPWLAAQKSSYLRSCGFNSQPGRLPGPVVARRVAERPLKHLLHGIRNFRSKGRASVEVEVYAVLLVRTHRSLWFASELRDQYSAFLAGAFSETLPLQSQKTTAITASLFSG
jgi:hypothetical protein